MANFPARDTPAMEKAAGLKMMAAAEVVAAAHERCGRGEEVHAALKSDFGAGMRPSGRFGANAAWLWLAAPVLNAFAPLYRVVRRGRQGKPVLGPGAHLMAARQPMNLTMPPPATVPGRSRRGKATQRGAPDTASNAGAHLQAVRHDP